MFTLITNFYNEQNEARRNEFLHCLHKNLENESISQVIVLTEDATVGIEHPKLIELMAFKRPTLKDMANKAATFSKKVIIANSDIYFDETLGLAGEMGDGEAYALTRWNESPSGYLTLVDHGHSQDAWILNGSASNVTGGNYYLGIPGSDNRFAYDLKEQGLEVVNPAFSIRAIHLHNSGIRHYKFGVDLVPGPYHHPYISRLSSTSPLNTLSEGFNKDTYLRDKFQQLVTEHHITTIIETGTYMGFTTLELAKMVHKVYTVEVHEAYFTISQKNLEHLPNVEQYFGHSPVALKDLLPKVQEEKVLIFLDAHWNGTPLLDELKVIAESGLKPIIAIHDFMVPGKDFGYDSYDNQPYVWEWIEPSVKAIYGQQYRHYYNEEATGAYRGVVFIEPA